MKLELLLEASFGVRKLLQLGHCKLKMDTVFCVILTYVLYLLLRAQFLKECLVVSSPLADGQFCYYKCLSVLNGIPARDEIPTATWLRCDCPSETFVPGDYRGGLLASHHPAKVVG